MKKIFRVLFFTLISVPYALYLAFFLWVVGQKYMDFMSLWTLFKEFVLRRTNFVEPYRSGGITYVYNLNRDAIFILIALFCVSIIFVLMRKSEIFHLKAEKFLDNVFYVLLMGPLMYGAYYYVPLVWRANNPSGFFILLVISFFHIVLTSFLNRYFIEILD